MKSARAVVLLLIVAVVPQSVFAEPSPRAVAEAYGMRSFSKVKELAYTFNATVDGRQIARSWIWRPRENVVLFKDLQTGRQSKYDRDEFDAQSSLGEVERWFINDQYWLLFPFHLVWDKGVTFTRSRGVPPIDGATEEHDILIVRYPAQGGYTPGDVYELFLTPDSKIAAWIYRKGGSEEPTRITSWEDHKQVGPILLSFERKGTGGFRIWFSEVTVEAE